MLKLSSEVSECMPLPVELYHDLARPVVVDVLKLVDVPVLQGLTLVPISAQLELTLPLSAQIKLALSPVYPK